MRFAVRRPDGSVIDVVPLDDPDDWNAAEKWAYLAHKRDQGRPEWA